jgi:hypothetical protein
MTPPTEAPRETRVMKRLSHAEQIADKCVHFTGIMEPTCKAGVRYQDVAVDHAPVEYRREGSTAPYRRTRSIPCVNSLNLCGATCAKREMPTPEAVAARVAESEREIGQVFAAMKLIRDAVGKTDGGTGTVDCPRCSGERTLRYSVASNGHIHARCSTGGCLAWME